MVDTYEVFSEGQIDAALDLSHGAFDDWRRAPWAKRAELMNGVGRELRAMGDELAETVSREMGKPITEAQPKSRSAPGRPSSTPSTAGASSRPNRSTPATAAGSPSTSGRSA